MVVPPAATAAVTTTMTRTMITSLSSAADAAGAVAADPSWPLKSATSVGAEGVDGDNVVAAAVVVGCADVVAALLPLLLAGCVYWAWPWTKSVVFP